MWRRRWVVCSACSTERPDPRINWRVDLASCNGSNSLPRRHPPLFDTERGKYRIYFILFLVVNYHDRWLSHCVSVASVCHDRHRRPPASPRALDQLGEVNGSHRSTITGLIHSVRCSARQSSPSPSPPGTTSDFIYDYELSGPEKGANPKMREPNAAFSSKSGAGPR